MSYKSTQLPSKQPNLKIIRFGTRMIPGKTYSYNCKVNKREPLPRDKWDIAPNTKNRDNPKPSRLYIYYMWVQEPSIY